MENINMDTSVIDEQINSAIENKRMRKDAGLTDEERTARRAAKLLLDESERRRKAEKHASVAAKRAAKKPPHVVSLDKAEAKLPQLSERASYIFAEVTGALDIDDINALAQHLAHTVRKAAVKASLEGANVEVGDTVRITVGPAKLIGKTGVVKSVKRIHCYLEVEGEKHEHYAYVSDVVKICTDDLGSL
jgi:hypothetical protein